MSTVCTSYRVLLTWWIGWWVCWCVCWSIRWCVRRSNCSWSSWKNKNLYQ